MLQVQPPDDAIEVALYADVVAWAAELPSSVPMPEGRLARLVRALADLTAKIALPGVAGSDLRRLRLALGVTQAQMAELVEPGMLRSRIADWELGRHRVPQRYWKHLRHLGEKVASGAPD